jgi:hypothetical protein
MRAILALTGLVAVAACGGNVVVDPGSGEGGAPSATSSGNSSGTTVTSSTTASGMCGPITCAVGGEECQCDMTCGGQSFTSVCKLDPDGTFFCECLINGMAVGACNEGGQACDIEGGCCSQFFF